MKMAPANGSGFKKEIVGGVKPIRELDRLGKKAFLGPEPVLSPPGNHLEQIIANPVVHGEDSPGDSCIYRSDQVVGTDLPEEVSHFSLARIGA